MTGFVFGLLAFFLWILALAGAWWVFRISPGPAKWSILNFRRARRTLAVTGGLRHDVASGSPSEALAATSPASAGPVPRKTKTAPNLDLLPERPATEREAPTSYYPGEPGRQDFPRHPPAQGPEAAEVEQMVSAVMSHPGPNASKSSDPPNHARRGRGGTRGRELPRGPQRAGRITYVLFDDEGLPLLD